MVIGKLIQKEENWMHSIYKSRNKLNTPVVYWYNSQHYLFKQKTQRIIFLLLLFQQHIENQNRNHVQSLLDNLKVNT